MVLDRDLIKLQINYHYEPRNQNCIKRIHIDLYNINARGNDFKAVWKRHAAFTMCIQNCSPHYRPIMHASHGQTVILATRNRPTLCQSLAIMFTQLYIQESFHVNNIYPVFSLIYRRNRLPVLVQFVMTGSGMWVTSLYNAERNRHRIECGAEARRLDDPVTSSLQVFKCA